MKPLFRSSLLLFAAIAFFASCKNSSPKQTKFIPKEASFVATVNTKSLQGKLMENQATIENLLKTMTDANDTAVDNGKKEWEDLKNSGIDLDENIYLSVVQKGGGMMGSGMMGGGSNASVTAIVGGLEDASKFEAYIKKKDAAAQIKKEEAFTYASKNDGMVAWGKEVIVFMSYNEAPAMDFQIDSAQAYNVRPVKVDSSDNLMAEMTAYFNLKDDQSISSIAEFRDLAAEKADGSLWINSAASVEDMPIPLPKVKELLQNNFTAATINFEDGKVVMNSKSYTSGPMGDLLEKYTGSTVDLDLIKNYPSNDVAAFFVASFNPDFINGLIKYLEVGSFVEGFVTKTLGAGYKLEDVLKSIKGDMAMVFSDVKLNGSDSASRMNAGLGMTGPFNSPKMLINLPVGDKAQFNRLMDTLVKQGMMVRANNQYALSPMLQQMGFKVSVDDKQFLIGSDSVLINQYRSGTAKSNIDAALLDVFKGKSSAGFVDLERIMNTAVPDSSNAESFAAAKATFKNIRGYTNNYNGKHIEGRLEINLKNEKENSFTSLMKFFAASAKNFKHDRQIREVITDTADAPQVED